jgi:glycosyltransferase involved in cell wall biosynthesis
MIMQADVTIFLPVYNGANYIQQAIDSVLAQTYTNWTFLIVDNCSTDNTAEICKPYLADPRFTYVLNETNLGVHGNFHKALSLCDTPYFAYLSHDDIYVRPDAFAEARGILEADKSLAMVNAPVRWLDQNSEFIPSFGASNVGFQGKVLGKAIAKACVVRCRNLYGIAVLSRTEFGQHLQLDKRLHQASDVNFFAGISDAKGGERDVFVLQNPAYAIRFHQTNNTLRQYDTLIDEMNIIAQNHGIELTPVERIQQKFNAYKVRLGKWVFYQVLNRRAKAKSQAQLNSA